MVTPLYIRGKHSLSAIKADAVIGHYKSEDFKIIPGTEGRNILFDQLDLAHSKCQHSGNEQGEFNRAKFAKIS